MTINTELWDGELWRSFANGEVEPKAFTAEVQKRTIEAVVLRLENGSQAQRV